MFNRKPFNNLFGHFDMKRNITIYLDILRCPNTCRHCEREEGGQHHSISLNDLRETVRHLELEALTANVNVTVDVGLKEPMAHPDFFSIQTYLDERFPGRCRKGIGSLTIGSIIARDPEFLTHLRAYNPELEEIQITLADTGDAHDRFVCRKGAFRDIEAAIGRILSSGLRINWAYIVHRDNVTRIEPMSAWVHSQQGRVCALPFRETLFLVKPQGRGRYLKRLRSDDLNLLPKRFHKLLSNWGGISCSTEKEIMSDLQEDRLQVPNIYGIPFPIGCSESCNQSNAASVSLEVEHNGDCYPFCHEHHPAFLLGNVNHDSLATILNRYTGDAVPALHARRILGMKELAARHGQRDNDELHHGCSICRTLVYRHLGLNKGDNTAGDSTLYSDDAVLGAEQPPP